MVSTIKQILVSLAAVVLTGAGVAAAGAAGVPVAAGSAGATGADPTSWTVSTAPGPYGSGRSVFGYTVNAGDKVSDAIDIANPGTDPVSLKVYAADAFTTGAGKLDIRTDHEKSTDLGAWVKPAVPSVTIAPGHKVRVPFSVAVPANATPGDHVGGIVTVLDQESDANGGTVQQRSWLSIKVRVSGEVAPQLEIDDVKLDLTGTGNPFGTREATISYTVHNTGNTVLGGLQKVTVSGELGRSSDTTEGDRLPELLPGESRDAEVHVDEVHAMLWASGQITVTPVLTDAAGSTTTLEPITVSDRSFVSIWSFVLVMVLLVLLVTAFWMLIRLVKRRRGASRATAEIARTSS